MWPSEEQEEPEPGAAGGSAASAEAPDVPERHAAPEEGSWEPAASVKEADVQEHAPGNQPDTAASSKLMSPAAFAAPPAAA